MRPITGGEDMLCSKGELWKHWRSISNPGFSLSHIMTLVPEMIKDVLVFRDILREHVKRGDIFRLEDQTTNLTLDIIGRVVLSVFFLDPLSYYFAD
jgi:cytochrome P450